MGSSYVSYPGIQRWPCPMTPVTHKKHNLKEVSMYTWPGSNWRPSACWADVIATRPQVLLAQAATCLVYTPRRGSSCAVSAWRPLLQFHVRQLAPMPRARMGHATRGWQVPGARGFGWPTYLPSVTPLSDWRLLPGSLGNSSPQRST